MSPVPGPEISIVVASFSGAPALARCLESLSLEGITAEVIVATELEAGIVAEQGARFPSVVFLRAPRGTGVFRLRALGIEKATAPLVALVEDHCTLVSRWAAALLAAHRAGHALLGGPVENGRGRAAWDWALYFCEYGALMAPLPEWPETLLAVNAAYDRQALEGCREVWRQGFYENEVHDALVSAGHRLKPVAEAGAASHLGMSVREATAHLFQGGRRYGRHRKSRAGRWLRVLLAAGAPGVPIVLFARLVWRLAARRPRRLPTLLASLPGVLYLLAVWGLGEALGYLGPIPVTALSAQPQGG